MTVNTAPLPEVCVCYILSETPEDGYRVLLGRKKKGLGRGNLVGPGGKLEPGETPEQAVVREVLEESGLVIREDDLIPLGCIRYEFPFRHEWSQISWVFAIRSWHGDVIESDELLLEWIPVSEIPFERMWDDAKFWLPAALAAPENYIERRFVFGADLATVVDSDETTATDTVVMPEARA